MKVYTLVALAIRWGPLAFPQLEAHDCCHGHQGCLMMSGTSADAAKPGAVRRGRMCDPSTAAAGRHRRDVVPGRGRSGGTYVTLEGRPDVDGPPCLTPRRRA
jgi:hypothetical protein